MTINGLPSRSRMFAASAIAAYVAVGCGGGGSGSDAPAPAPAPAPALVPDESITSPRILYMESAVLTEADLQHSAKSLSPEPLLDVLQVRLAEWMPSKQDVEGLHGQAWQVGAPRGIDGLSSPDAVARLLRWTRQSDGHWAAAISVKSIGAAGLRLGVVVTKLPDEALIRVYKNGQRDGAFQVYGRTINANLASGVIEGKLGQAERTWWTPDMGADEVVLEISIPAEKDGAEVRIALPRLSHIFRQPDAQANSTKLAQAGACNLDASCSDYAVERNAVAQIAFVRADGRSYNCTGTLLNNYRKDFTPYVVTANHCISNQAEANSIQTRWFYRTASCNSSNVNAASSQRLGGAKLLLATASTDSSLLQLNEMPPVGATYAGWDALGASIIGSNTYGLHHPFGELLKYSEGQVDAYGSCSLEENNRIGCVTGDADRNWVRVLWQKGVTEAGSSGSGLFSSGRLVGTLSGGNSQCGVAGGSDYYGRFDKAFQANLWRWLAR